MDITYERINKDSGNYYVFLDEKNVGRIVGKTRDWELKNLFGASISKGITRDLAVKNALENLWEYELEFELFHNPENNQEENLEKDSFVEVSEDTEKENAPQVFPNVSLTFNQISPDNTSFLTLGKEDADETIETIEENNLLNSEPKLGDDYQPMEREPVLSNCARIAKNFLVKTKEYVNKIGFY